MVGKPPSGGENDCNKLSEEDLSLIASAPHREVRALQEEIEQAAKGGEHCYSTNDLLKTKSDV